MKWVFLNNCVSGSRFNKEILLFVFSKRNDLNWAVHPQLWYWYQSGLLCLSVNSSVNFTSEESLYIFIDYKIYQRKVLTKYNF